MPKVSVIIPAYNSMMFLPRTLESVLKQTFQDYEVIVVNDGSQDDIEDWIKAIDDKRVRLISQLNQGQSAARNTGIKHSESEYIAFLDSDDLWEPQKLEKQVNVLDNNPDVGLVYAWVHELSTNDQILKKVWRFSEEGNIWKKLVQGNEIACGSVPMIRRSCLDTVGEFYKFPFACEDWDLWLRIAAEYPFKVIKEVLVYYRSNPSSLSHATPEGMKKRLNSMEVSFIRIIESAFDKAPPEYYYLRAQSLASAYMHIAWVALNKFENGYQEVDYFQKKALSYMPELRHTLEYKRLNTSSKIVDFFGFGIYQKYRSIIHLSFLPSLSQKVS